MADIESLKQALAVSPDNVPLLLLLGEAHVENFQLAEARQVFDQILQLEPRNPAAKTHVAQLIDFDGKSSEAILRVEQVCAETPNFAPAWLLRSKFLLNEGNAAEARQCYDTAVQQDSSLHDDELLRRIREAGGTQASTPPKGGGGTATPQQSGDGQAGAFYQDDPGYGGGGGEDFYDDDDDEGDDLRLRFEQKNDVDFSKVGGMEAVKEDIRMKILYPMENKELFEAYGKKAGGGVLLYGPPGCGKTLISRATAGEINARFYNIGLHQILDMWIGKSEEKLHEIFEMARRNTPSVLFFDEVDALAADRNDMRASSGRTLINQFLAEMDGSQSNNDGVLVLGATNAPWHLDSAFLRPGRFDRLIFVPPPDEPAREAIIHIMAEGKPVSGLDPKGLAKKVKDFSGADLKAVFDNAIEASLSEAMKSGKIVPVTQKQLVKGARRVKPSTRKWFESAKNYALYANQSGFYDEVLDYLGISK